MSKLFKSLKKGLEEVLNHTEGKIALINQKSLRFQNPQRNTVPKILN